MKKKIILGILIIVGLFTITGCEKNNKYNSSSIDSSKEYNIKGIKFKLDKEESISKMKYTISKSFDRSNTASSNIYNLYYDDTEDIYSASNLAFSLSFTADIMQSESNIESDINKLKTNSSLKNITREQKKINGIKWEYISLDNYYETGSDEHFTNHSYYYETNDGNYYTTYIVSFNKADNIEELEEVIMNSIVFE